MNDAIINATKNKRYFGRLKSFHIFVSLPTELH
jgi:hypothetical protein